MRRTISAILASTLNFSAMLMTFEEAFAMANHDARRSYPTSREQKAIHAKARQLLDILEAVDNMDLVRLDMFAWQLKHSVTTPWVRGEVAQLLSSRLENLGRKRKSQRT
jgi:hypothetical protein